MDASHGVFCRCRSGHDRVDEIAVANETVFLEDPGVPILDHDGLVKILERKPLRVMPSVVCLGDELRNESVRQMAVDAASGSVVTGLGPRIVLLVHDVAVGARLGLGRKIRKAFCIVEGEESRPCRCTHDNGNGEPDCLHVEREHRTGDVGGRAYPPLRRQSLIFSQSMTLYYLALSLWV